MRRKRRIRPNGRTRRGTNSRENPKHEPSRLRYRQGRSAAYFFAEAGGGVNVKGVGVTDLSCTQS